jgi:hypothetical protein
MLQQTLPAQQLPAAVTEKQQADASYCCTAAQAAGLDVVAAASAEPVAFWHTCELRHQAAGVEASITAIT